MSYEQPDKGAKFTPRDHPEWLGKLFLFWPESVETVNFSRPDGTLDPTDMVTADVAIIDLADPQTGKPTFLESARIGGSALAPQLKKKLGKKVLGRLNQTPPQGQKSGAYFLADFTPQDVQTAEGYEAQFPRQAYQSAPSPQPAPSWGGSANPAAPAPAWGTPPQGPGAPGQATPSSAPPNAWNTAAPPPTPAPWPDGLREFLTARGYDTSQMTPDMALQIAKTLQ